jgi:hypothetical protein
LRELAIGRTILPHDISLQPEEARVSRFFTPSPFSRSILFTVFVLTVLTTVSAKSIKMVTTWFNPKYEGQAFHKVLVIGVAQNLEVRADFEDEIKKRIGTKSGHRGLLVGRGVLSNLVRPKS